MESRTPAVDCARVLSLVLRLARGRTNDAAGFTPAEWSAALSLADRERLGGLAWHRCGAVIRERAPRSVAEAWRGHAIASAALAEARLASLRNIVAALREVDVEPIVLKGLPLAQRLYGDSALRPGGDTDLFIATGRRQAAEEALSRAGWQRSYGRAPREAAFRRREAGGVAVLELHSTLADDNLLEHLRLPEPAWREVTVGDITVRAHDDELVPACIALHLAKRFAPPILWALDLLTVWGRLDGGERARARQMAARCRLERCLADGLMRAHAVAAAEDGDPVAAAQLGYTARGRRDRHNAWRVVQVADSPADAARAALAWAWPHELRGEPARYARTAIRRLRTVLTRRLRGVREKAAGVAEPPERGLAIAGPIHQPVRDLMALGVPVWIRATGSSMRPTIAPGTRVRLVDAAAMTLSRGDVVLARLPSGRTVLHRVREVGDNELILRGDNTVGPDAPVHRAAVLAVADRMERGGRVVEMPRRRLPTWRSIVGDARRWAGAVSRGLRTRA